MARKHRITRSSGRSLLLVDDDEDYLEVTRRLLEAEGHAVVSAKSGPEALGLLRSQHFDLMLLDYFMPGMTGEEVVAELRRFDKLIQVVLQTGYASEQPARSMLRKLDIQGYYDKSEGPEKLLLWTDAGLKTAETLQRLQRSREGLRYILDLTPDLYRRQPVVDLLQGILSQVSGLVGAADCFIAALPESPLTEDGASLTASFPEEEGARELLVRASTGRFRGIGTLTECLQGGPPSVVAAPGRNALEDALAGGKIRILEEATIVPLRVGTLTMGLIYLGRPVQRREDVELLELFANQATVAIQNMQLYEMAALDPLTGVHARRFFEQWLRREVRTAFRAQHPLALIMLDMDNMKGINDGAGHLTGDAALAAMGRALREATRENDVVGRFGGDEFVVLLPQTNAVGAAAVGARILEAVDALSIATPGGEVLRLRSSLGLSELSASSPEALEMSRPVPASYFHDVTQALLERADKALYTAKAAGGCRLEVAEPLSWPPPTTEGATT